MNDDELAERAERGVVVLAMAMRNEIRANRHKGDWAEMEADQHVGELLYHAAKLEVARRLDARAAMLEYAGDVANHCWFLLEAAGALDPKLLNDGHAEFGTLIERAIETTTIDEETDPDYRETGGHIAEALNILRNAVGECVEALNAAVSPITGSDFMIDRAAPQGPFVPDDDVPF